MAHYTVTMVRSWCEVECPAAARSVVDEWTLKLRVAISDPHAFVEAVSPIDGARVRVDVVTTVEKAPLLCSKFLEWPVLRSSLEEAQKQKEVTERLWNRRREELKLPPAPFQLGPSYYSPEDDMEREDAHFTDQPPSFF